MGITAVSLFSQQCVISHGKEISYLMTAFHDVKKNDEYKARNVVIVIEALRTSRWKDQLFVEKQDG